MKNLPRKKEAKICYLADIASTHATALLKDTLTGRVFSGKVWKRTPPIQVEK
jgi:hypothetical protein